MAKVRKWYVASGHCSCGLWSYAQGKKEKRTRRDLDEWLERHPDECSAPPAVIKIVKTSTRTDIYI